MNTNNPADKWKDPENTTLIPPYIISGGPYILVAEELAENLFVELLLRGCQDAWLTRWKKVKPHEMFTCNLYLHPPEAVKKARAAGASGQINERIFVRINHKNYLCPHIYNKLCKGE